MFNAKSNITILEELNAMVEGHLEAKKQLINLVNRSKLRHYQKWIAKEDASLWIHLHRCLLIGGSGTGKTFLVQCLQKILNFPLLIIDATRLNPTGASGGIKSDQLESMIIKNASEFMEENHIGYHSVAGAMDQTVVFIDEVDKLGTSFESSGHWNQHVQSNFLTIFGEGKFNNISFIFAGAFQGLTGHETKKDIGFNQNPVKKVYKDKVNDQDLVKFGLIPEFVGRLSTIIQLDDFTEEDYYKILVNRLLPQKEDELLLFKYESIDVSEETLRQIAHKAYNSGQGIRALRRNLDLEFLDMEFNWEDNLWNNKLI